MNRLFTFRISIFLAGILLLCSINAFAAGTAPCDTVVIDIPTGFITICEGDCFVYGTIAGYDVYEWSTGMSGPSIMVCSAGIYTVTVTDANGCTGVGVLEVEQYENASHTISVEFCAGDSVEVLGVFYNTPGVYTEVIAGVSVNGCDSILTIFITEIPVTVVITTLSFCSGDSVPFRGIWYSHSGVFTQFANASEIDCDTVFTITIVEDPYNTNVVSLSMCSGDSIWFNDMWVYEARTYFDTIASLDDGCDTIVIFVLDIDLPAPTEFIITPDSGPGNGSIELEVTSGFTYLWSTGETGSIISNLVSGDYSVTITNLSSCENIITYTVPGPFDDLDDIVNNDKFEVYPNPFLNDFNLTIPYDDFESDTKLIVVNYLGQKVYASDVYSGQSVTIGSAFPTGLYFVYLISQEEILASAQVVKTD